MDRVGGLFIQADNVCNHICNLLRSKSTGISPGRHEKIGSGPGRGGTMFDKQIDIGCKNLIIGTCQRRVNRVKRRNRPIDSTRIQVTIFPIGSMTALTIININLLPRIHFTGQSDGCTRTTGIGGSGNICRHGGIRGNRWRKDRLSKRPAAWPG